MTKEQRQKKENGEVHDYIRNQINTFIEPLVYNLVLNKPANPIQFAIDWLHKFDKRKKLQSGHEISSDEEQDAEHNDEVRELEEKIKRKRFDRVHNTSRIGISQEVVGVFNYREEIELGGDNLCQQQKQLVKRLLRTSMLFQNIDQKDEEVILKAIKTQKTEEYELILKQGEKGENFYIVASGQFDCYKLVEQQNVFVKTYSPGDSFGQLALLYNSPRAASIVTKVPGKLLILPRRIFSQVIKIAAFRKQTLIQQTLEKVEILSKLPKEQKYNIIGVLKEERFEAGEYVIKQGERGEKFYIVIEGVLAAQKRTQDGCKVVYTYEEGHYFGQLALLNNEPRQASIKALSSCKVASMTRQGFKRLFGSLQCKLKQKTSSYHE